ncbi:MAG: sporulation integral membrane protein YlbJ [Bacillota bacterium]
MQLLGILLILMVVFLLRKSKFADNVAYLFTVSIVIGLIICIISYPRESVEAARVGLSTWLQDVLPALLPFFIGAELLIRLGIVRFIGILLEPVIRPIFNVPGEGSFILAMSITSGYPVGVKLAVKLRNEGMITKEEAQRIISFCSTSGPLFMLGAVAIGMFHNVMLGIIIAISHYCGAIAVGIMFRFYRRHQSSNKIKKDSGNTMIDAIKNNYHKVQQEKPSLGFMLGSAVKDSIETLLMVGGFIILFSVIIQLLTITGFIDKFALQFQGIWAYFRINSQTQRAIVSGLFEMTIGCKLLSQIGSISFLLQAVIVSMLISWSGFSIHAQAASIISNSDLSTPIYILSKMMHALFSAVFVTLTTPLIFAILDPVDQAAFFQFNEHVFLFKWSEKLLLSSELFIMMVIVLLLFSLITYIVFYFYRRIESRYRICK